MDRKASLFFLLFEVVMIAVYWCLAKYDREADPKMLKPKTSLSDSYPMFQDVHVMIFIGFGFLMTFLRKYGFSSVGFNFLLAAATLQWGLVTEGLFNKGHISIGIHSLIEADILVAAVLISMGAVLGKTTPLQLMIMAIIETIVFTANELLQKQFQIVDVGGSIIVHVFGAYFGLAVSRVLGKPKNKSKEGSSYQSDLFAMIGTLFLWVFWPSFNGALSSNDAQRRAVINTYLSIAASCVTSFAVSAIKGKEKRFDMVHVQNATLAGGVAVGTVADLVIQPYAALTIGSLAGVLSTLGYIYIQEWTEEYIGVHDTCGVHNLHGMPGVFAGIVSAIASAFASADFYGSSLYLLFPARSPKAFTEELTELQVNNIEILPGEDRSAVAQAGFQLLALAVTLAIAIGSGFITGFVLKGVSACSGEVCGENYFEDEHHWHVPTKVDNNTENKSTTVEAGQDNNAFV